MQTMTRTVTTAELEARRQEILDKVGMTLDEFHELHESGVMSAAEWDAWDELAGVEFLLG